MVHIRLARLDEIDTLTALVYRSFRELSVGYYSEAQIEAALGTAIRVDRGLVSDRNYFVAEINHQIAGCGGWSAKHPTIHESFLPVPRGEVRAMFVDPKFAHRGIGRALLRAAEQAVREAGFPEAYLVATQGGVGFYEREGYERLGEHVLQLENATLPLTFMRRPLSER